MVDRVPSEQKAKPGIGFDLKFTINYPVSLSVNKQEQLKERARKDKFKISNELRRRLLLHNNFKVKNETELVRKNKVIKEDTFNLKKHVIDEMGFDPKSKEFISWCKEQIDDIIENGSLRYQEKLNE